MDFNRVPDGFTGKCNRPMCRICWEGHVRDEVLGRADFGEMAALVDQLMNSLYQEGEDRNYYQAILDGSWPTAVEQLEHALIRAKARVNVSRVSQKS